MVVLAIPHDVIFRDLDGESVILNLTTGTYFGLNEVGTRIWHLIAEHASQDKILEALLSEFDVEASRLRQDLSILSHQLLAKGLLITDAPKAQTTG